MPPDIGTFLLLGYFRGPLPVLNLDNDFIILVGFKKCHTLANLDHQLIVLFLKIALCFCLLFDLRVHGFHALLWLVILFG